MTDDDKAIAQAIHGILREAYLHVPWTLDQTFSDMCRKDTVYYLASDDQNQVVGFLATTSVMDEIEITNLAVAKAYQSQGVASLLLKQLLSHDGTFFWKLGHLIKQQDIYTKKMDLIRILSGKIIIKIQKKMQF